MHGLRCCCLKHLRSGRGAPFAIPQDCEEESQHGLWAYGGGAGAVVRSLPLDPKVPGSIHGSAESGIFGDLLSR